MSEEKASSQSVLLIESDSKEAEVYSGLVQEVSRCQIDILSRPDDSLEWIERISYHLIVIDVDGDQSGPDSLDAIALLERIKRLSPTTGVVIISENASVEGAVTAMRLGAEDYLQKPFTPEAFKLAVKRGLDRKMIFGADHGASGFLNLLNTCQMISSTLDQNRILRVVQSYFSRELHASYSAIYTYVDGKAERANEGTHEKRFNQAMEEILDITLIASNPFGSMLENGEVYRFLEKSQLTPGMFLFHFRIGEKDYFNVCLAPVRPKTIEIFENRIRMLRTQIELAAKNIEEYQDVQQLVYVDDATGLYNTRYMNFILDKEIEKAKTHNQSFAILFIDADKFKKVNDVHGHLAGTNLLNELGRHLRELVRDSDTVFRYGGDEFVAVLSPCDLETARTVAERIRSSVEAREFKISDGSKLKFTVSIGVALFPDHATTKKEIINCADRAMYEAKHRSRNMVYLFGS